MRIALACLLAFALVSCDAAEHASGQRMQETPAPVDAAGTDGKSRHTPYSAAVDPLAGLSCRHTPSGWSRACTAPGYDITGSLVACRGDGASLGAILSDTPIVAIDRLIDGRPVATLAPGQFVCIQFMAEPTRSGTEPRMYVTAIAPGTIPECRNHDCGAADAESRWHASARSTRCDVDAGRYTSGCVSGWVRATDVEAYSMGLGGQMAERTDPASEVTKLSLGDAQFTLYGRAPMSEGECVVGARMDDLGRQEAVVSAIRADGHRVWSIAIPPAPDLHATRATHCACSADACYVAVATDTQAAQSLSQTLLSVVRLDPRSGDVTATRAIERVPGTTGTNSVWLERGTGHFVVSGARITMRGQWRAQADDEPRPFRLTITAF